VIVAKELDPSQVSPGVPGFVVTFALALACWLLFRSLTAHLRRVNRSPEPAEPGGRVEPSTASIEGDDAVSPVDDAVSPVDDAVSPVDDAASPADDAAAASAAITPGVAKPKP
jgi:hypothetical protein